MDSFSAAAHDRRPIWLFVGAVCLVGAAILAVAARELQAVTPSPGLWLLVVLTVASGRFRIKVPGHEASVSVSEVFVFASVLLYGPAPATITVAVDGLLISLTHRNRRLYRALFNIAEPAISASVAAHAFFAAPELRLAFAHAGPAALILPSMLMAGAYFASNSLLTSAAVAIESRMPVLEVWKGHALYTAMNYYAAASVAVLVFKSDGGLNIGVVGLVAPLLAVSYAAYKSAASRIEDTQRHLAEVEGLYKATVETLAMAVDAKDQVTHGHIRRVQRHTLAVARALGVTDPLELRALEAASLLHDVGKLAVPDYVLNKPGSLSRREFEVMKTHAAKGAEILTAVEFPYAVVPVVRHHHEQWNGKGYPDGLAGNAIPFGARILTVVDCFDAVTSDRPYRRRMTDEQGIALLQARSGSMYDPAIVDAFVRLMPALREEESTDRRRTCTAPRHHGRHRRVGIAVADD
ncbi:MAG: HD-GYP domain-containing protein [Vicinamibacterales bacterium]